MFKKQQNSSKWQGKTQDQNYPLTIADMDLPLFAPFKERLIQKMNNLNNLTYKNRSEQYFSCIISWYYKHHIANNSHLVDSLNLTRDNFIECPSICNLIGISILAFTKQTQNILIFTPVYSFYINAVKALGREVVCCQLRQQQLMMMDGGKRWRYEFGFEEFERKMNQYRPKLIILCNPHNPTGRIFTHLQLSFIVKKAQQYDSYILSDEIMCDFTLYSCKTSQQQITFHQLVTQIKFTSLINYSYPKIIIGNSISKVFNCESIQGGYGIIRSQDTRNLYNLINYKISLMLIPIIYTNNGQEWIRIVNKLIWENYQLLTETFKLQSCLKIFQLQSSYLTTIQFEFSSIYCRNQSSCQFVSNSLKKYGIFFTGMQEYFYPPTSRNIYRIAIAMQHDKFKKFIVKFKQCVNFIKGSLLAQNDSSQLIRKSKL